jgi:hypothetical protein
LAGRFDALITVAADISRLSIFGREFPKKSEVAQGGRAVTMEFLTKI